MNDETLSEQKQNGTSSITQSGIDAGSETDSLQDNNANDERLNIDPDENKSTPAVGAEALVLNGAPESEPHIPVGQSLHHPEHAELQSTIEDWQFTVARLNRWQDRARESAFAHHSQAAVLYGRNLWIGIPLIVLTAGNSVIREHLPNYHSTAMAIASVLAALQTFLSYRAHADRHVSAANNFSSVRREIEAIVATPHRLRDDLRATLVQVRTKLDHATREAPPLSPNVWKQTEKRQEGDPATPLIENEKAA